MLNMDNDFLSFFCSILNNHCANLQLHIGRQVKTAPSTTKPADSVAQEKKALCPKGHVLKPLGTSEDGWCCDACNLPEGCLSGITDLRQYQGLNHYHCEECNFDFCEKCYFHYTDHKASSQGVEMLQKFLNKVNANN